MIMVKYQGQIESLSLAEEFEDHVLQTALALGSRVHLWRSSTKYSPGRLVRGLSLQLCPGQEPVSLLLSPEGLLIPEQAAEEATFAPLLDQPWCEVRTHCGGVDGHTALIELLELMKQSWFPNLNVLDATGYWEHRNPQRLQQRFREAEAEPHPGYTASVGIWHPPETPEDPSLLMRRLEQLSQLVRGPYKTELPRACDVPPRSEFDRMSLDEAVLWADFTLRQQELRSDRIRRIIEESLAIGMTADEAAAAALRTEGPLADLAELTKDAASEPAPTISEDASPGADAFEGCAEEWWRSEDCDGAVHADDGYQDNDDEENGRLIVNLLDEGASQLLHTARQLMLEIVAQTSRISNQSGYLNVLHQGLLELVGELGQDVSSERERRRDRYEMGFSIVHLRRATERAAYVTGAITGLLAERQLSPDQGSRWLTQITEISRTLQQQIRSLWETATV